MTYTLTATGRDEYVYLALSGQVAAKTDPRGRELFQDIVEYCMDHRITGVLLDLRRACFDLELGSIFDGTSDFSIMRDPMLTVALAVGDERIRSDSTHLRLSINSGGRIRAFGDTGTAETWLKKETAGPCRQDSTKRPYSVTLTIGEGNDSETKEG